MCRKVCVSFVIALWSEKEFPWDAMGVIFVPFTEEGEVAQGEKGLGEIDALEVVHVEKASRKL